MRAQSDSLRPRNGSTTTVAPDLALQDRLLADKSLEERTLEERIVTKTASVGVVGLGYVGLPLALTFVEAGYLAAGIDVDAYRIGALRDGRSHVTDVTDQEVRTAVDDGRFLPTTDWSALAEMDVVTICVPTPLRKTKDPDLTYVIAATEQVARMLRPGQLVVLESTTYPGTTEEIVLPRLSATGLTVGRDFFLAYSPERVDPGNTSFQTRNIPKVVGGITPSCGRLAAELYRRTVGEVVPVSSTKVAEMVKLLENTFRNVNVALVNEMAMMSAHMGIDVWEVIGAAATKPFGFMPFYPGPGLGGHCIPIDPVYLQWKARIDGFEPQLIQVAQRINQGMPQFVVTRAMELLNELGRAMRGSQIHVMGLTYKRDISDVRESPAIEIVRLLLGRGARVTYSDPFVPSLVIDGHVLQAQPLDADLVSRRDLVVVVTDHTAFDYEALRDARMVLDTRNALSGFQGDNIRKL
jgi:UDP-N-acetyl-D-glucosamine dehydrogenase